MKDTDDELEAFRKERESYEASLRTETSTGCESLFTPHLMPGEQLLWAGAQEKRRISLLTCLPSMIFGGFFGGFAIFWMSLASQANGAFWLFGSPFLLVGLGIFFSPFLKRAKHRNYAITDRRLLSLTKQELETLQLELLINPAFQIHSPRKNVGMVSYDVIEPSLERTSAPAFSGSNTMIRQPSLPTTNTEQPLADGMFDIKNPESVYRILNDMLWRLHTPQA